MVSPRAQRSTLRFFRSIVNIALVLALVIGVLTSTVAPTVAQEANPDTLDEAPAADDTTKKNNNKNNKKNDQKKQTEDKNNNDVPAEGEQQPEQPQDGETGSPAPPPANDPRPGVDVEELLRIQELYDEAIGDEAEALARYEIAQAALEKVDARIARVEGMLVWTRLEIEVGLRQVALADDSRKRAEAELERVQTELENEILRLKRHAVEAFMGGSSSNEDILTTLLNAESIDTVENVREYAAVALEDQEATVQNIEALEVRVDELVAAKAELERVAEVELAQVKLYEDEIADRVGALDELRTVQSAEKDELGAQLAEIQTRRTEYEQRLNAIQVDSDSASQVLQRSQAAQASGPPPVLHPPVLEITRTSSDFGPRFHPIFHQMRMHNGNDFGGDFGDPIFASAAGVVVMAEARGGYGNVVVIDHGDRWGTLYAHQSSFNVVVGQQVARGDVIGSVGSTGYSTGPHLHFELRQFGDPRDAWNYLAFAEPNPVPCDVMVRTGHQNDLLAAQERDECAEFFETEDDEPAEEDGGSDSSSE